MAGKRKVRMLVGVSGSRHDGRPWPVAGSEITVPGWEAEDLIRAQIAVDAGQADDEPEVPEPAVSDSRPQSQIDGEALAAAQYQPERPLPVPPPEVSPLAEVSGVAEVAGSPEPEPEQAAEPEQPAAPPAPSAPKQSWIDYAVSQGATADEAASMTKADLMSRYGGRL